MKMEYRTRIARRMVQWLTLVLLAGCAPTEVETIHEYYGKSLLPRPDRVLVYDFAVSANDVKLNSAIGARLANLVTGAQENEEQVKVGRAVAKALAESLVKELDQLGLPVEHASSGTMPTARTVMIHGQFLTIDEGNRLRRMVIGFGVGGTDLRTKVQVYQGMEAAPLLLQEFEANAESSKKPGMGPMVGVGAAATSAAGAAAVSSGVGVATEFDQTVEGDAKRTAKEVAKPLSQFFAGQGWISAEKVIK
jgi:uncharacterized protein DUF4410